MAWRDKHDQTHNPIITKREKVQGWEIVDCINCMRHGRVIKEKCSLCRGKRWIKAKKLMGIWGTKPTPSGSLYKNAGGRETAGQLTPREAARISRVEYVKEQTREAERARERDERRARRESKGGYHHPGKHPESSGHIHPKDMTPRQQKAHGVVVTRTFFGGYTVESRSKIIGQAHAAADAVYMIDKDLRKAIRAKDAKTIARLKSAKIQAQREAHRLHRRLG